MTKRSVTIGIDTMDVPGYESLKRVFQQAYNQAAREKGFKRHAIPDLAFENQQILGIPLVTGDVEGHFLRGQAIKKIIEASRLELPAAQREICDAINYLAALYLLLEKTKPVGS